MNPRYLHIIRDIVLVVKNIETTTNAKSCEALVHHLTANSFGPALLELIAFLISVDFQRAPATTETLAQNPTNVI